MKYIHSPSDIPSTPHFAVIVFDSIYIPGDERSQTHPGHGYPASTENKIDYIKFDSRTELETWVTQEESSKYKKNNYKIIESRGLMVESKFSIK